MYCKQIGTPSVGLGFLSEQEGGVPTHNNLDGDGVDERRHDLGFDRDDRRQRKLDERLDAKGVGLEVDLSLGHEDRPWTSTSFAREQQWAGEVLELEKAGLLVACEHDAAPDLLKTHSRRVPPTRQVKTSPSNPSPSRGRAFESL